MEAETCMWVLRRLRSGISAGVDNARYIRAQDPCASVESNTPPTAQLLNCDTLRDFLTLTADLHYSVHETIGRPFVLAIFMPKRGRTHTTEERAQIVKRTILQPLEERPTGHQVARDLGISESTVRSIRRQVLAQVEKNGGSPLDSQNLKVYKHTGPKRYIAANHYRSLPIKTWRQVADECGLSPKETTSRG